MKIIFDYRVTTGDAFRFIELDAIIIPSNFIENDQGKGKNSLAIFAGSSANHKQMWNFRVITENYKKQI